MFHNRHHHQPPLWFGPTPVTATVPELLRYLFMIAARWADDVRNNRECHRGPWHYINFPIVAPSDKGLMDPPAPADENILAALKLNLDQLRGDGDPAEKAVALCWVFHLIGDVHQPLHTTAFFSSQWPNGDKGGNAFHVRVRADRAVVNLHSLWDGLIIGSQSYQAVSNVAIRLRNRPDLAKAKLTELTANEHGKLRCRSALRRTRRTSASTSPPSPTRTIRRRTNCPGRRRPMTQKAVCPGTRAAGWHDQRCRGSRGAAKLSL